MKTYRVLSRSEQRLLLEWRDMPSGPANATWLRVLRAGICGTDLQILRGVRSDTALVLGHEGVGEVVRNESDHCDLSMFAIFNPVDIYDQDHILGHSYDGVFGEVVRLPTRSISPAASDLPIDLGPLVEPLATVMYAWELLTLQNRPAEVGIWGGGSTAVIAALVTELNGARAHIFHRRPERLSWLARREALATVNLHCLNARSSIQPSLPRLDAGIICVSRDYGVTALEQALGLVRDDGWIDLFGGFAMGERSDMLPGIDLGLIRRLNVSGQLKVGGLPVIPATRGRVWLTGHRGTSNKQLTASQQILIEHPEIFGAVISDVISLEVAAEFASEMIREVKRQEYLKVIIDMTMTEPMREPDLTSTLAQYEPPV